VLAKIAKHQMHIMVMGRDEGRGHAVTPTLTPYGFNATDALTVPLSARPYLKREQYWRRYLADGCTSQGSASRSVF
jgi:hypothetical protein